MSDKKNAQFVVLESFKMVPKMNVTLLNTPYKESKDKNVT